MRGVRDRLRGRLHLACCNGQSARHFRERAALAADLAKDVRDGRGGPVHAHAKKPELVGDGVRRTALHLSREIAPLDLAQYATRGPQAVDDLHQHGRERGTDKHQDETLLDVQRPSPAVPGDLREHRDQRKGSEIDEQRAPRLATLEIQRGLQRGDDVRAIQHVTVRSHRERHRGNQQAADDEVELRVPGLEGAALDQSPHTGVCRREARGERENEPRRDGREAGELDRDHEGDAETQEPPAGARVREHVLAVLRESLLLELMLEGDHMRNR